MANIYDFIEKQAQKANEIYISKNGDFVTREKIEKKCEKEYLDGFKKGFAECRNMNIDEYINTTIETQYFEPEEVSSIIEKLLTDSLPLK